MNKAEILAVLQLDDAFEGFSPLPDSELWGWNGDTPIFSHLINKIRPKTIIEVGTWLGLSTSTMAQALIDSGLSQSSSIITVDTWLGSKEHWMQEENRGVLELEYGYPTFYKRFLSNMKLRGLESLITPLPLTSQIAGRILKEKNILADLIYIDGSHDEKDVYDDICLYWELLSPNGCIFGDDYQWGSVASAVRRFCEEHNLEYEVIGINWIIQKTHTAKISEENLQVFKTTTHTQTYKEPELTYLVLDYQKKEETRKCLQSIKKHTHFPHKVIYLHNGENSTYAYSLFEEGLVDQFIQTHVNNGLGIGTRDLFAASFSPYSFYLQNDQYLTRDFSKEEFTQITNIIGQQFTSPDDSTAWMAASVDLAGAVCGLHTYSERGHIIQTDFYKQMEKELPLKHFGAGPWHDGEWREGQIQRFYKAKKYLNFTYQNRLVEDNGYHAIRENRDGSVWEQRNDTKELRLLIGPVTQTGVYPNLTDAEWDEVIHTQSWPEWKIPEKDVPISYHQWN